MGNAMTLNITRTHLCFITIGYTLFLVSFFQESIAPHYMPSFHVTGASLYGRIIFVVMMAFFLAMNLIRGRHVPGLASHVLVIITGLSILGLVTGVAVGNSTRMIAAHLFHNVIAFTCIASASTIALDSHGFLFRWARVTSLLILSFSSFVIVGIFSTVSGAIHLSVSLQALAWPLCFGLAYRGPKVVHAVFAALLLFLTLKRGLWVAAIMVILLGNGLILSAGLAVISIILAPVLIASDIGTGISEMIDLRLLRDFGGLDDFTSGRWSVISSVFLELQEGVRLLFGTGFGSQFNAKAAMEFSTTDWITNGVDVIFAHFWLLYGIVPGTVVFLGLSALVGHLLLKSRQYGDSHLTFFVLLVIFTYFASFSTFIAWDPFMWTIIGLSIGRLRSLERHEAGA